MGAQRTLHVLEERFTISKLAQFAELPKIIAKGEMCFSARTDEELVVVTPDFMAPNNVQQEIGWRAIKIEGEPGFKELGIVSSVVDPLTQANIPTFVFNTFTTVYIFLPEEKIVDAVKSLQHAGHSFEHKEVNAQK